MPWAWGYLVFTCWKLKWTVKDAFNVIADTGQMLNFKLDPPIVVQRQCMLSVQRWRWIRVEKLNPQLSMHGSGRGATMEPIWQQLKASTNDVNWNPEYRGALKSAYAGWQWAQTRVNAAGWAEHDRCILCLSTLVDQEAAPQLSDGKVRTAKSPVVATQEQILKTPVGNLNHRIWSGQCIDHTRYAIAPPGDLVVANDCDIDGRPAWERALIPRPPLPKKAKLSEATFYWSIEPGDCCITGAFYVDGSCFESGVRELARCG